MIEFNGVDFLRELNPNKAVKERRLRKGKIKMEQTIQKETVQLKAIPIKIDYAFLLHLALNVMLSVLIVLGLRFNAAFTWVAFVINALSYVIMSKSGIVFNVIYMMSFSVIYKGAPETTSFFTILECLAVIFLFFKEEKLYLSKGFFFAMLLCGGYLVVSCYLAHALDVITIFKQLIFIAFLYLAVRNFDKKNMWKYVFFYALGVFVSSVVALFADKIPNFYEFIHKSIHSPQILNRFTGLNGDPNYYSINLIVGLMGVFAFYNHWQARIPFWVLYFSFFYFGIEAFSRSFILMYALFTVFMAAYFIAKKRYQSLGFLTIIIVIAIGFLGRDERVIALMERFVKQGSLNNFTTGRSDTWVTYLKYIFVNPKVLLMGVGLCSPILNEMGTHNLYIECLYFLGVIGSALYLATIVFALNIKKKELKGKQGRSFLIAFFPFLMMYFFLQGLFSHEFIVHILLSYVIFQKIKRVEKKK